MKHLQNPFRPARVEYEKPGFLWVSPLAKRVLSAGQPVYIGGTRGSGKTSLLRTLSTREQLTSDIIGMQIPPDAFDHFSVLLRVPSHLESVAQKNFALSDAAGDGALQYREFALILELHIVQSALVDLIALQDRGRAAVDVRSFGRAAQAFIRAISPEAEGASKELETSDGLLAFVTHSITLVQRDVMRRRELPSADRSCEHRPGSIVAAFAQHVLSSIALRPDGGQGWGQPTKFRICIDECEFLNIAQQRYLNSMVRASEYPLTWVIAFVPQKFDRSQTIYEGAVLSGSDRQYQLLDDIADSEFEKLCQAVTSLRLYYAIPERVRKGKQIDFTDDFFDLHRRLGAFTLAQLAYRAISKGLKKEKDQFLDFSQQVARDLSRVTSPTEGQELELQQSAPPVHLAYALKRLNWNVPSPGTDQRTLDSFKAALRKKSRAGFLGVCRQHRIEKVPYAGYRIIMGLADKCVRDFLNIMASIFDQQFPDGWTDEELLNFCEQKEYVSIYKQQTAIHRASRQKYEDLPQYFRRNIDQGQRLIDALGTLTYELQTSLTDSAAFTLPERGIFRLDLTEMSRIGGKGESIARIEQLIRIGRVEGYLRDVTAAGEYTSLEYDSDTNLIWVRLHRLLAPHFGFSYRGAIHQAALPADLWLRILESETFSAQAWSRDASRRIAETSVPNQEELPFV